MTHRQSTDQEGLLRLLRDDNAGYLDQLRDEEREAFEDMLVWTERRELTPKQRWWVNQVLIRLGLEEIEGPIDDGTPAEVRFTKGDIPRGKEVELLVKDKPLKPPTRVQKP
jgi:hypothetical protein